MEAIISNIKRGFNIRTCNWKGWVHFQAKVIWSVLAYNFRVMTELILEKLRSDLQLSWSLEKNRGAGLVKINELENRVLFFENPLLSTGLWTKHCELLMGIVVWIYIGWIFLVRQENSFQNNFLPDIMDRHYLYDDSDYMYANEFADLVTNITAQKKVIWMQPCYSGGFKNYFNNHLDRSPFIVNYACGALEDVSSN